MSANKTKGTSPTGAPRRRRAAGNLAKEIGIPRPVEKLIKEFVDRVSEPLMSPDETCRQQAVSWLRSNVRPRLLPIIAGALILHFESFGREAWPMLGRSLGELGAAAAQQLCLKLVDTISGGVQPELQIPLLQALKVAAAEAAPEEFDLLTAGLLRLWFFVSSKAPDSALAREVSRAMQATRRYAAACGGPTEMQTESA